MFFHSNCASVVLPKVLICVIAVESAAMIEDTLPRLTDLMSNESWNDQVSFTEVDFMECVETYMVGQGWSLWFYEHIKGIVQ